MIDEVAFAELRFDDSQLNVSSELEGQADALERIAFICQLAFSLGKFTESRWCSVGKSARVVVMGLFIGLEPLVSMARQDDCCTYYSLHGFSTMSLAIKLFVVHASTVSVILDSVMTEMIEDDRVLRHIDHLKGTIQNEMPWLLTLSEFVWSRVARLVGMRAQQLGTSVIECVHVGLALFQLPGYCGWRVVVCSVFPSAILLKKLDRLALTVEAPTCDTTNNVWKLLNMGDSKRCPRQAFGFAQRHPLEHADR